MNMNMNMNMNKLKSPYEGYPFKDMTKFEKFKLWLFADISYFFMKIWWKITKQY